MGNFLHFQCKFYRFKCLTASVAVASETGMIRTFLSSCLRIHDCIVCRVTQNSDCNFKLSCFADTTELNAIDNPSHFKPKYISTSRSLVCLLCTVITQDYKPNDIKTIFILMIDITDKQFTHRYSCFCIKCTASIVSFCRFVFFSCSWEALSFRRQCVSIRFTPLSEQLH